MTAPQEIIRLPLSALASHPTAKFAWTDARGRKRQGFVLRCGSGYAAYENACPHLDIPLDWDNNEFFEEEGRYLVCSTHGALFRPDDGFCVAGPCARASLPSLHVKEADDELIVLNAPPSRPTGDDEARIPNPNPEDRAS